MINPGIKLPHFTAPACVSLEQGSEFATIDSASFEGQWNVLYTYPKDFTFVCPTEIVEFDRMVPELHRRNAALFGGSTDNEYSHLAWRRSDPQLQDLRHPLLFISGATADALGILHPTEGVALRATIITDPQGIVRFASANELSVGRNVAEVVRVLDALQTGELTACNWQPGQDVLRPG